MCQPEALPTGLDLELADLRRKLQKAREEHRKLRAAMAEQSLEIEQLKDKYEHERR